MPSLKKKAYNKYAWTLLNQTVKTLTIGCARNGKVMFTFDIITNTIDADEIEARVIQELKSRGL